MRLSRLIGPETLPTTLKVWVVSDGRSGIENQALGLAEALGRLRSCQIQICKIAWPKALSWLPLSIHPGFPCLLKDGREQISSPWPDIWIGNGRACVPLSIRMRSLSAHKTFVVQLQNPLCAASLFDLVIPPDHDGLKGVNVFPILGAPHRVTDENLDAARKVFSDRIAPLPDPKIAVLIGGRSKAYDLGPERATALAKSLKTCVQKTGGSLLLTFSRRTPQMAKDILTKALEDLPAMIWPGKMENGEGENPYFAYLALASVILVTEDSVNMMTEAAATGKPIYRLAMDGGRKKHLLFHQAFETKGISRPFAGAIDNWHYPPLQETQRAAKAILDFWEVRSQAGLE